MVDSTPQSLFPCSALPLLPYGGLLRPANGAVLAVGLPCRSQPCWGISFSYGLLLEGPERVVHPAAPQVLLCSWVPVELFSCAWAAFLHPWAVWQMLADVQ